MRNFLLLFTFTFALVACSANEPIAMTPIKAGNATAYFAGGCFWCMEAPFEKTLGVEEVISGYMGGERKNPTYKEVSSGSTRHIEAVKVIYNPKLISYQTLLEIFWMNINPTDKGGQFADRGYQYSTAIFYQSKREMELAKQSKEELKVKNIFKKEIVTPIREYKQFYQAEEYHQNFYKKNITTIARYKIYRRGSGRDRFLDKYWEDNTLVLFQKYQKPSKRELKQKLSKLEFKVTQEDGTERAFKNSFWNNKADGVYIDIVSGEPLFSSRDKFKSGTGWPSFTKPINANNVLMRKDISYGRERIEVRSRGADSHLGHVFKDGPEPTGLRYCINSASLKFVAKADLKGRGLERFLQLFP